MTSILQHVRKTADFRCDYERKERPSRMTKINGGMKAIYLGTDMEAWGNRSKYLVKSATKPQRVDSDVTAVKDLGNNFYQIETYYSIGD